MALIKPVGDHGWILDFDFDFDFDFDYINVPVEHMQAI